MYVQLHKRISAQNGRFKIFLPVSRFLHRMGARQANLYPFCESQNCPLPHGLSDNNRKRPIKYFTQIAKLLYIREMVNAWPPVVKIYRLNEEIERLVKNPSLFFCPDVKPFDK